MEIQQDIQNFLTIRQSMAQKQKTIKSYEDTLNEFFIEYWQKPIEQLTINDIYLYKTWKENKAKKRATRNQGSEQGRLLDQDQIKNSTMNKHYSAIRQFLNYKGKTELAKNIKSGKTSHAFDIIEFNDIKKIFQKNTLKEFYQTKTKSKNISFYIDRFQLLIDYAFGVGTRLEETVNIQKTDLKLERKIPVVEIKGKGDTKRYQVLSKKWLEEYNTFLDNYPIVKKSDYIFTTITGAPLKYSTIRTYIKDLGYFIKVPKLSAHKLRHAYALKDYEEYKDVVSLSKALGHKDIRTTMIYLSQVFIKETAHISPLDRTEEKP